eukprot:TRINITY_DN44590_c0_g1_i1.p2 TRINITY_DN44590_c0_g1~~TRINITY_DN44590_c0_g1_i1.p2  ORF type:complete len:111 (+),score=32.90 TRINITY_DN44590_c0_g1_i1:115-447(+)
MIGCMDLWAMLKDGSIDFVGQKQAHDFQCYTIWLSGFIGFFHGYAEANFRITFFWIFGASCFVTVVCLPSWPWWNRNPIAWLEPKPEAPEAQEKEDPKKKKKAVKKDKDK